jgi:septum formation protein
MSDLHLPPLILASNSPRRRQLLALGGWPFRVQAVDVDENPRPGEEPRSYVSRLARDKARAAASHVPPGSLVIAADTTVADGELIMGKPADEEEAVEMLQRLRGHVHQVFTAIAMLRMADDAWIMELCATDVPMRSCTDAEIRAYVATGDPLDKAGAYAIQHAGFHPVESLQGCYANVVGLPLCHLTRGLSRLGVASQADVPAGCQKTLQYQCPVYQQILEESRWI